MKATRRGEAGRGAIGGSRELLAMSRLRRAIGRGRTASYDRKGVGELQEGMSYMHRATSVNIKKKNPEF